MPIVRKAVIPIAGLGTRHFPASHAVKKELFPVVGPDGIARALFHYHLLELQAAGIEQVCIIVQPGAQYNPQYVPVERRVYRAPAQGGVYVNTEYPVNDGCSYHRERGLFGGWTETRHCPGPD